MRILFTMTGSWGTGSGTVVESVVAEMARQGHETAVLYPQTEGAPRLDGEHAPEARHYLWPFPLEGDGARLATFPLMIPDPNPTNFADAPTFRELAPEQLQLYIDAFGERLDEVIEDYRPDIIESQHIWAMPYVVAQTGRPYVVSAHHSDQMGFHHDERIRPYATEAAQGAAYLFALTQSNHDEVVALYQVPPERVVVLGNGYEKSVFFPTTPDRAALFDRFDLDIPDGAPLITFAGKLSKTKGVDVLYAANHHLQARFRDRPEQAPHLIVFGTGALDDVLDGAALGGQAPHYEHRNVHLIGHQPYPVVRDFHSLARLSVMPSRTEGFGLAALEAMGCGLPLVVTEIGAADTYAVGEVVPPEDPRALAEGMARLLEMPEADYARLRDEVLARAHTFSWREVASRRLEYYARALAER